MRDGALHPLFAGVDIPDRTRGYARRCAIQVGYLRAELHRHRVHSAFARQACAALERPCHDISAHQLEPRASAAARRSQARLAFQAAKQMRSEHALQVAELTQPEANLAAAIGDAALER